MKINKKIIATMLSIGVITLAGVAILQKVDFQQSKQKTIIKNSALIKLNKNQLIGITDVVVLGKVKNVQSFATSSKVLPEEKEVYSNITFEIETYLYNPRSLAAKEITIQVPGGKADGINMEVADSVSFQINHKYVIFLRDQEKDQGFLTIIGPQGAYEVDNIGGLGVGENQQSILQSIFGRTLTIEQLKDEIKTAKSEPVPGQKIVE